MSNVVALPVTNPRHAAEARMTAIVEEMCMLPHFEKMRESIADIVMVSRREFTRDHLCVYAAYTHCLLCKLKEDACED